MVSRKIWLYLKKFRKKNLEKKLPEVVEDGGEDELSETGDEAEAAVGVFRPNLPMRFIPLEMRLVKPSFNSRPLNIPASEFGCGSDPEDLEDDLKGDFNSRGGGSNKYLGGQTVNSKAVLVVLYSSGFL